MKNKFHCERMHGTVDPEHCISWQHMVETDEHRYRVSVRPSCVQCPQGLKIKKKFKNIKPRDINPSTRGGIRFGFRPKEVLGTSRGKEGP